jgi:hypothetical protein
MNVGTTWPVTSQSNSMRTAASCCFTPTRALDGTLRSLFEEWYPGLANDNAAEAAQAEVA